MIFCAKCGTQNYLGRFYCSECGARLSQEAGDDTRTLRREDVLAAFERRAPAAAQVTLLFNAQRLPLSGPATVSLGRADTTQAVRPDVDLNPFGAFDLGVSRLHASLELAPGAVTVTDLGSANGTYLNGQRLIPYQPYLLRHNDRLAFARLEGVVLLGMNAECGMRNDE